MLNDAIVRLQLLISKMRAQSYDGAATMAGNKSGVARKFLDVEPRALFTHCYGHKASLASGDAIKGCQILENALAFSNEIIKLIKQSPKRSAIFDRIKREIGDPSVGGIRKLCPTRWTVKARAMYSILTNYLILMQVFEESLEDTNDTNLKARLTGVLFQMKTFDFFFGLKLAYGILQHTDNLAKALQKSDLSAAEGYHMAKATTSTLEFLKTDENFLSFWSEVKENGEKNDIEEPTLGRKRSRPANVAKALPTIEYFSTVEEKYKSYYMKAFKIIIQSLKERYESDGYTVYMKLENILFQAAKEEDYKKDFKSVTEFYGDDFDIPLLQSQLLTFSIQFKEFKKDKIRLNDIVEFMKQPVMSQLLSEVGKLLKLLLSNPATNAQSERIFSNLRRTKDHLRNSMGQARLNWIMILNVHKKLTESLNLAEICNEFISGNERRLATFGKFEI